ADPMQVRTGEIRIREIAEFEARFGEVGTAKVGAWHLRARQVTALTRLRLPGEERCGVRRLCHGREPDRGECVDTEETPHGFAYFAGPMCPRQCAGRRNLLTPTLCE